MSDLKKFRCQNPSCRTEEFVAADPVCPECKVDGRLPRYSQLIVELAVIHFDPPDPLAPKSMGQHVLACDPSRPVWGSRATGIHSAVTCEQCRGTQIFRDTYAPPLGKPAVDDAVVSVEGGKLKITETKG